MVENGEIDRFACSGQSPHRAAIRPAWPRVAEWVIVRQDNASAPQPCGVDDDVPNREFDRFRLALVTFDVEATGRGIDMSYPKPFPRASPRLEAPREEAARSFLAVEDRGVLSALEPHAPILVPARRYNHAI